jgi:serine/threonine-protein kinase
MNRCNTAAHRRFIEGLLNEAEESAFVAHLDACPACRQGLEATAGNQRDWQTVRELLAFSSGGDCCLGPTDSAELLSPTADFSPLSFLGPTDDPAMIGRIGPYEIQGIIGRGGFGWVLKGRDRALDRIVAIKVLDPAAAGVAAARERFAREARAMASISHEHVVPIYGVNTHAGLPYFVMEYVAGGSLERRLKADARCDVVSIVRIGLQIAQALAAAHRQGLVHRDIKPGNVLLDQGTERARVADFGLARVGNEVSSTRSGFVAGTPQYMSPEQVRGETCDAQTDLFSLGAVMYALCTGHSPFRGESVYGVMQRIVHDVPRPIREQNPAIPIWLERFVLRLLEKEKQRRFASAGEVARLLQDELAYLQNPGAALKPERFWLRKQDARKQARLRLTIAAVAIGVCLLVGGVSVYRLWPVQKVEHQAATDTALANPSGPTAGEVAVIGDRPVALVPLWSVDGMTQAREFADQLQARWHLPTTGAAPDLWTEQDAEVRQRIGKLSSELGAESPTDR